MLDDVQDYTDVDEFDDGEESQSAPSEGLTPADKEWNAACFKTRQQVAELTTRALEMIQEGNMAEAQRLYMQARKLLPIAVDELVKATMPQSPAYASPPLDLMPLPRTTSRWRLRPTGQTTTQPGGTPFATCFSPLSPGASRRMRVPFALACPRKNGCSSSGTTTTTLCRTTTNRSIGSTGSPTTRITATSSIPARATGFSSPRFSSLRT